MKKEQTKVVIRGGGKKNLKGCLGVFGGEIEEINVSRNRKEYTQGLGDLL